MSRQCRGYANSLPNVAPFISGLSTTSSILGATTIVTIFGENFRNYSTVYFGTTLISNVTFFSSGQLSFYVPAIATVGTYPIQVFNDTLGSNIVYFTIDNSVGFWNQHPATGAITNNNATGGININGQLTVSGQIYNTATQPAPTNSSTIVPTTAWVQSAISYYLPTIYTLTSTASTNNWTFPLIDTYGNAFSFVFYNTSYPPTNTNIHTSPDDSGVYASNPPYTPTLNTNSVFATGNCLLQRYTNNLSGDTFCAGFNQSYSTSNANYGYIPSISNYIGNIITVTTQIGGSQTYYNGISDCPPQFRHWDGTTITFTSSTPISSQTTTLIITKLY